MQKEIHEHIFTQASEKSLVKHVADADGIADAYLFCMKCVVSLLFCPFVSNSGSKVPIHYGSDDHRRWRFDSGMKLASAKEKRVN